MVTNRSWRQFKIGSRLLNCTRSEDDLLDQHLAERLSIVIRNGRAVVLRVACFEGNEGKDLI
jgi:hypothetical protein